MSILTPISRGCKGTLTDGSVRYMIEFGPLDAVAAATLFGMPGTEMGVVALKDGRALNGDLSAETIAVRPNDAALPMASDQVADTGKTIKTAQSDLVKWSGVLSNDEQFWEWVGLRTDKPTTAEEAAAYIRRRCTITSRSQLAYDPRAASNFRGIMRLFDQWKTPL